MLHCTAATGGGATAATTLHCAHTAATGGGARRRGPPWRAERSGARLASGTTKEVLGFIIDFLDFKDFLGFPILLLGFPRIS